MTIFLPKFIKSQKTILALGAESAGVFAVCKFQPMVKFNLPIDSEIKLSENFGDLLIEKNFTVFKKAVLKYLKIQGIKPDVVLTDMHPFYKTTIWAEQLAKKYKIPHIKIQHHLAHIFSALGDEFIVNDMNLHKTPSNSPLPRGRSKDCILKFNPPINWGVKLKLIGIAADGTGYGYDGKIWGGEIFKFKIKNLKFKIIERIGHLENQTLIGGDLAVSEPARMLISILNKCKISPARIFSENSVGQENQKFHPPEFSPKIQSGKKINNNQNFIYSFVKKYYSKNEFNLLYNQLQQNFNCMETSSTARILDAAAVLLGFTDNRREFKHQAEQLLAENSTEPYYLKPVIEIEKAVSQLPITNYQLPMNSTPQACRAKQVNTLENNQQCFILQTTPLFEFLVKNIQRDKKRLAATAQYYLARGFYEIIKKSFKFPSNAAGGSLKAYFAGGMANNKIISSYLKNRGVYLSRKIPRGDPGLAFGQIVYYLWITNFS